MKGNIGAKEFAKILIPEPLSEPTWHGISEQIVSNRDPGFMCGIQDLNSKGPHLLQFSELCYLVL